MGPLILFAATFGVLQPGEKSVDCLERLAPAFEATGESASDVAEALIEACSIGKGAPKPGSFGAEMTREDYYATQNLIREAFVRRAHLYVVRVRACRKQASCSVTSIGINDKVPVE